MTGKELLNRMLDAEKKVAESTFFFSSPLHHKFNFQSLAKMVFRKSIREFDRDFSRSNHL